MLGHMAGLLVGKRRVEGKEGEGKEGRHALTYGDEEALGLFVLTLVGSGSKELRQRKCANVW